MKTIMIVDDTKTARLCLKFSLKLKGFHIIDSSNGKDALEKLDAIFPPSLIITDIHMPEMNGIEFIMCLRRNDAYRFTPIIVLSSDELKGKEALVKGANAYVLKSTNTFDEIMDCIQKLVGGNGTA
ncbi:MAG: response regulator [Spirochaetales bacterium]|nr:response regulator [Spirochaetales bacterium]